MIRILAHVRCRLSRHRTPCAVWIRRAILTAAVVCAPRVALAVDGMLEASSSHQEGRAGAEAYSSDNQRLRGSVDQRVLFSRDLSFYIRYGALRETQENRTAISFSSYRRELQDPYFALMYERGPFEAGLYGNVRRTDYFWSNQASIRDEYVNGTAFLMADFGTLDLEGRYTEGRADRLVDQSRSDTRDHRLSLAARARLTPRDRLQYEFSRSRNEYRNAGYEAEYRTHRIEYDGNRKFAANRGRVSLMARFMNLEQDVRFGGTSDVRYLEPDWGGFVLDDTPEDLDPLEPEPTVVPALHDFNRVTPTVINIGDSAPVVREFGGDYRNIIFDFGEAVTFSSAFVYVDTILGFPDLMRWDVYVSDDPEGRDWGTALGPGTVTWSYRQEANGQQGWAFTFATPVTHRRVKVVNSKLGPTEPDIYITEFEVYGPDVDTAPDIATDNQRYRVTGTVGYLVTPNFDVSYRGDYRRSAYGDTDRDDRSIGHVGEAAWSPGTWRFSGALTANTRRTTSGNDTEVYGQRAVVMQKPLRNLDWRVGWQRTADTSYNRDQVTNNVSGDVTWRAAPALVLDQKISYGVRDDAVYDLHSSSWVLVTNLRSSPRRTVGLDLRRTDRWVSAEAGSGFTTFNDTELRLSWAIFPQLNYSGIARYQVRETSDWIRRNTLSLSPLPGGSMSLTFYVTHSEDTRAATRQRAAGARAIWRPRPTLLLEGGVEYAKFTKGATHSSPSNLNLRGYWTF